MTRYDEWRLTAPEDATPEDLPRAQRIDWLERQIRAIERGIEDGEIIEESVVDLLDDYLQELRAIERDTDSAAERMRYLAYGD